jgi:hypothetical protein
MKADPLKSTLLLFLLSAVIQLHAERSECDGNVGAEVKTQELVFRR